MDDAPQSPRRKRVYLFELDSTRSTDEEIVHRQCALYHEVVTNGNVVVLTYNQLVDSRGLLSLLGDEDYYRSLRGLFEIGAAKFSQYGSTRYTLNQENWLRVLPRGRGDEDEDIKARGVRRRPIRGLVLCDGFLCDRSCRKPG